MKKKILIGLLMALVVIFVGFAIVKAMGGGGEEPLFVKTSEVTEQDLSARIFADGTVVSKESFGVVLLDFQNREATFQMRADGNVILQEITQKY